MKIKPVTLIWHLVRDPRERMSRMRKVVPLATRAISIASLLNYSFYKEAETASLIRIWVASPPVTATDKETPQKKQYDCKELRVWKDFHK